MKTVYLASPFFSDVELENVKKAEKILEKKGLAVHSPRLIDISNKESLNNADWAMRIFQIDCGVMHVSDYVVALYYGMYSDSGTAWEIGYSYALGKKLVLVSMNPLGEQSLMPINGSSIVLEGLDALEAFNFKLFEDKDNLDSHRFTPETQT